MPTTTVSIYHDQVSFNGRGYVELDKKLVSHDSDMRMEMTLEFSTWSSDALILWQGKRTKNPIWEDDFEYNYMALGSKYLHQLNGSTACSVVVARIYDWIR
jgi:hypothetical protein